MNKLNNSNLITTDYCIIGSGLSGLLTALELAQYGSVYIITKEHIKESNSQYAQGGIAAAITEKDSPQKHFNDTQVAGCYHGNIKAMKLLTEKGPYCIQSLINLGVEFDKKKNKLHVTKEGAHSVARVLHKKDTTGKEIINKIIKKVQANQHITICENHFVTKILTQHNEAIGCTFLTPQNIPTTLYAKATVIATGGAGQIYEHTSNPSIATADGLMLAYHAGAILTDIEFFQFHPTSLYNQKDDTHFLISEATRGEGAVLETYDKKEFMNNYHEKGNLAPRDVVSRAIFHEYLKTKHPIYLNLSKIKNVKNLFPNIYTQCKQNGFDIQTTPIPITPCAHYLMGGIQTNLYGESSISNLFAVGESAHTGVHGANRLASNSLLECIVFAYQAANYISKKDIKIKKPTSKTSTTYSKKNTINTKEIKKEIQSIMWDHASIIRNKTSLLNGQKKLKKIQKKFKNFLSKEDIECQNILLFSQLVIEAALFRKESLGAHFREDHPNSQKNKYLILIKKDSDLIKQSFSTL